ncbi:MAG: methionyl-tRNA formyltransferase [Candidatus Parcubacteria bacterium]|nr:MAG: methionyl-tRNA formyltransferase [Candidatus Parcubacteria bacterium]
MKNLPVFFFGSSRFSVYVLKEFIKKYKPLLIITNQAKPAGRGLKIKLNEVYSFCLQHKLEVIELPNTSQNHQNQQQNKQTTFNNKNNHHNANTEQWQNIKLIINQIQPLAGIVAAFSKIIPKNIIDLFPKGIINVHPSLLPKYRGPNPLRETILQGDNESGITIFKIDELIDHGPIIVQEKYKLKANITYEELELELGILGGKTLTEIIENYLYKDIELKKQNDDLATYTKKLKKDDGFLNLTDDFEIWNKKIRAYNPWPGTFIKINDKILKIFSIEKLPDNFLKKDIKDKTQTGQFFTFKNNLCLKLKDAYIILQKVQLENRKIMSGKEFLNGFRKLIFNSSDKN